MVVKVLILLTAYLRESRKKSKKLMGSSAKGFLKKLLKILVNIKY